ncbi:gamma subclass chorismate mutase AroQ [Streptomyces sp. NPDC088400]|uniref:gamma subclass chorismate mutase AroQ n=1 Tax=Streptomyces sp. NPDC088400 TaxID=3365861 RepID=UPI0037F1B288
MHPTPTVRRRIIAATVTTAVTALIMGTGTVTATAASAVSAVPVATAAPVERSGPSGHAGPYARLGPVAELSARRLATADLVAAAKWGTDSPIDDPAREQQVLDTVARLATELGADPAATVRIFRDQIEANKDVQRALHRRWDADASQAPTERPDLAEVRAEINRLNDGIVRAIAGSARDRTAPYCGVVLLTSAARVGREMSLDAVHMTALARSLNSVCEPEALPRGLSGTGDGR